MWKWLNELSVAARLLITLGLTSVGIVVGIFVAIWIADFGDRVGALETQVGTLEAQAELAQTERADFAEESRQRDEESRQRDDEILEGIREGQNDANTLLRTIFPMIEAANAETKLYVAEEVSGIKATIEVHGLEIENLKDTEAVPASPTP